MTTVAPASSPLVTGIQDLHSEDYFHSFSSITSRMPLDTSPSNNDNNEYRHNREEEDKNYTLESNSSPASASNCKLYFAHGTSPTKSTNFMHKHKRGFPLRTTDDLSAALLFGHHNDHDHGLSYQRHDSSETTVSEELQSSPLIVPSSAPASAANSDYSSDDGFIYPGNTVIRKKSGERVKSSLKLPGLVRTKSMPTTPTTKIVHFDAQLNQIRRFSKTDEPTAVSADSSPTEEKVSFQWDDDRLDDSDTDSTSSSGSDDDHDSSSRKKGDSSIKWEIRLPNFTKPSAIKQQESNVYLEHLFLSTDKTNLIGHVSVKNIDFQKEVAIRFTVDYWKTVTEVFANYNDDVRRKQRNKGYDRFTFVINLNELPPRALATKSMFFCVRYSTKGQQHWDNNNGYNYQIDFSTNKLKPKKRNHHFRSRSAEHTTGSSSLTNANFTNTTTSATTDNTNNHHNHSNAFFRPKNNGTLAGPSSSSTNKLTARYSFGSSFHNRHDNSGDGIFQFPIASKKAPSHPLGAKPAWDSRSYQDLLNNYCFFKESPSDESSSKNKPLSSSTSTAASSSSTTAAKVIEDTAGPKSPTNTTASISIPASEPRHQSSDPRHQESDPRHQVFTLSKSPKSGVFV